MNRKKVYIFYYVKWCQTFFYSIWKFLVGFPNRFFKDQVSFFLNLLSFFTYKHDRWVLFNVLSYVIVPSCSIIMKMSSCSVKWFIFKHNRAIFILRFSGHVFCLYCIYEEQTWLHQLRSCPWHLSCNLNAWFLYWLYLQCTVWYSHCKTIYKNSIWNVLLCSKNKMN